MKGKTQNPIFPLLFIAILFFAGCKTGKQVTKHAASGKKVVILAVNDMHAAVDNFPRFTFIVNNLKKLY